MAMAMNDQKTARLYFQEGQIYKNRKCGIFINRIIISYELTDIYEPPRKFRIGG